MGKERFDFATVALCRVYILTGACMALAYKYAGSRNKLAFDLIAEFINELKRA